jgi:hypothetical protein
VDVPCTDRRRCVTLEMSESEELLSRALHELRRWIDYVEQTTPALRAITPEHLVKQAQFMEIIRTDGTPPETDQLVALIVSYLINHAVDSLQFWLERDGGRLDDYIERVWVLRNFPAYFRGEYADNVLPFPRK